MVGERGLNRETKMYYNAIDLVSIHFPIYFQMDLNDTIIFGNAKIHSLTSLTIYNWNITSLFINVFHITSITFVVRSLYLF